MKDDKRVVFLDYLRVVACLMVMFVHACEQFYFGADGGFLIASKGDALWVTVIDSACRASVPLFVMASAYLLFPVTRPTGEFFRRRLLRVFVPFAVWCCLYTWRFGGEWMKMLFNFPSATGGHLWFVPMLLGLYLLMPLLSPWAERVGEKEARGWLLLALGTTLFPFLRLGWSAWFGADGIWSHTFGSGNFDALPFLYGECPWNSFGTFHYVSGFIVYLLMGFYLRRFVGELSWKRTLALALPLIAAGWALVWACFYFRIPLAKGWPASAPYSMAVELEVSWEFCSAGVAMTVAGYFLLLRKFDFAGTCYRRLVRPLSEASYGTYLMHIMILTLLADPLKAHLPTGAVIFVLAIATFSLSSMASIAIRRLPLFGKWICG